MLDFPPVGSGNADSCPSRHFRACVLTFLSPEKITLSDPTDPVWQGPGREGRAGRQGKAREPGLTMRNSLLLVSCLFACSILFHLKKNVMIKEETFPLSCEMGDVHMFSVFLFAKLLGQASMFMWFDAVELCNLVGSLYFL